MRESRPGTVVSWGSSARSPLDVPRSVCLNVSVVMSVSYEGQIYRCVCGRWMTGVGLRASASVVTTGLVCWSVAKVRLCRRLRHSESELQGQGWRSLCRSLETWPGLCLAGMGYPVLASSCR